MADIRFIIDVDGVEKVVKLRTETEKVKPAAKNAGDAVDRLSRKMANFGNTTNGARKNTNRFNATMQNAGYQVGDFFVQVQSGQNALVAFSQQGAQLAGLLPGLTGAIVGVGLVLGSMLARNLLANVDLFKSFTERLKEANSALSDLRSTSSTLARIESKELGESFSSAFELFSSGNLAESIEKTQSALRKSFDKTEQEIESLDKAVKKAGERAGQDPVAQYFESVDPNYLKEFNTDLEFTTQKFEELSNKRAGLEAIEGLFKQISEVDLNNAAELGPLVKTIAERASFLRQENKISAEQFQEMESLATSLLDRYIDLTDSSEDQKKHLEEIVRLEERRDSLNKSIQTRFAESTRQLKLVEEQGLSRSVASKVSSMQTAVEEIIAAERAVLEARQGIDGMFSAEIEKRLLLRRQELDTQVKQYQTEQEALEALSKTQKQSSRSSGKAMEEYENRVRNLREALAGDLSTSFIDMFRSISDGTKTAKEAFKDMSIEIVKRIMDILIWQPLIQQLSNTLNPAAGAGIFGAATAFLGKTNANGNAFNNGSVIPYANGGIVNSPTYFGMSGGRTGLMGEAGPEAILPLKRGAGGKLGVEGGGNVTVHQSFNFAANGDESVKRIIAEAAPGIAKMTEAQIVNSRQRGGQMRRVFS